MLTFGLLVGRIGDSLRKGAMKLLRILERNDDQSSLPQKLSSPIKLQAVFAGLWENEVIQENDNLDFGDRVWKVYHDIAHPYRLSCLIDIHQTQPYFGFTPAIGQSRVDRDARVLPRKLCRPQRGAHAQAEKFATAVVPVHVIGDDQGQHFGGLLLDGHSDSFPLTTAGLPLRT